MIARLSKRMASFFARNNVIKSEDEEVYEYGLQLLLSTVFNGIIALILAIISGTVLLLLTLTLISRSACAFCFCQPSEPIALQNVIRERGEENEETE